MISKAFAFCGFLSLALSALCAQAAPAMDDRLYDLGARICADVANGALDLPGAREAFDKVDAVSWERAEFCHCVGQEFGLNPAQKARMAASEGEAAGEALVQILRSNLRLCTPGQIVYGDLPTSKDDAWQCRQVIDGDRSFAGLEMTEVRAEMRALGKDREDICGCAAGYITAVEDLIDAYQMQMATGILRCLHQ
jgi:hypothetical protein